MSSPPRCIPRATRRCTLIRQAPASLPPAAHHWKAIVVRPRKRRRKRFFSAYTQTPAGLCCILYSPSTRHCQRCPVHNSCRPRLHPLLPQQPASAAWHSCLRHWPPRRAPGPAEDVRPALQRLLQLRAVAAVPLRAPQHRCERQRRRSAAVAAPPPAGRADPAGARHALLLCHHALQLCAAGGSRQRGPARVEVQPAQLPRAWPATLPPS